MSDTNDHIEINYVKEYGSFFKILMARLKAVRDVIFTKGIIIIRIEPRLNEHTNIHVTRFGLKEDAAIAYLEGAITILEDIESFNTQLKDITKPYKPNQNDHFTNLN